MKKVIVYELKGLYRDHFRVTGYVFGKGEKSVCIVGSMRGNEVQQLYCCARLVRKLKQMEAEGKIADGCSVLVIPCVNPYSINTQKRFWPVDNTDINRMFPGFCLGETTQRIADGLFQVISEYRFGIQFTSFYMPGEFMPHVRMMSTGFEDQELARQFGMPYVVLRQVRPYDTTTLNYNWQIWETQAFSMYTTTTTRVDKNSAGEAIRGFLLLCISRGLSSITDMTDISPAWCGMWTWCLSGRRLRDCLTRWFRWGQRWNGDRYWPASLTLMKGKLWRS